MMMMLEGLAGQMDVIASSKKVDWMRKSWWTCCTPAGTTTRSPPKWRPCLGSSPRLTDLSWPWPGSLTMPWSCHSSSGSRTSRLTVVTSSTASTMALETTSWTRWGSSRCSSPPTSGWTSIFGPGSISIFHVKEKSTDLDLFTISQDMVTSTSITTQAGSTVPILSLLTTQAVLIFIPDPQLSQLVR